MTIKVFSVGSPIPVAADYNTYLIQQQHVVKPSDESVTNTIVFQNDDHLVLPVQAGMRYFVQCLLIYTATTTSNLDFRWSVPTGSTFDWVSDALGAGVTTFSGSISRTFQGVASEPAFGGAGTAVCVATVKGVLLVGSTAGNLRAQWTQSTAGATASIMKAGSMVAMRRLI